LPEKKRRKKTSAVKALRQSRRARLRNSAAKSRIKTSTAKARTAVAAGDPQIASARAREACRLVDKAAAKGILHRRAAARRKSRLARALARVSSPIPPQPEEAG
jgi:small subunit ribosomal protein S20